VKLPTGSEFYIYLIPVGVFFAGIYQSLNYWLVRKKAFISSSINKVSRRLVEAIVQIFMGLTGIKQGLIVGDVSGNFVNVLSGIYQAKRNGLFKHRFSLDKIKYVSKRYSDFPKYNLIPYFLSTISNYFPVIVVNNIYTSDITGYFDLSRLVLSLPLAFISVTVSQVLLQRLSDKYNNNKSIKGDIYAIGIVSLFVAFIEIVIIALFAPLLFSWVFGETWRISGEYSQILVYSYAISFVGATLSATYTALNSIKLLSVWQLFYFSGIVMLLLFRHFPFEKFILIYVLYDVLMNIVYIGMIYYIVIKYENKLKNQRL